MRLFEKHAHHSYKRHLQYIDIQTPVDKTGRSAHRQTQTDRHRQTDRQTDTDRETERQTYTDRETDRQTSRQ